ncbi:MAG: galactose-1-phosphate uridylyltransferase [Rhodopirellula sp.]|nr:galactose-1-phosphate uridylyltransferase [Rhodopirellula sp.]
MAELRKDPILGDWVILAPERATRPFDHKQHGAAAPNLCPFCQGNEASTPNAVLTILREDSLDDWAVRVIPNRYPAVSVAGCSFVNGLSTSEFFERDAAVGYHEVIVESPSHESAMRDLSQNQLVHVLRAWRDRLAAVSADESIAHTMIFKNEGAAAGASLEHVHSQLLATSFIPPRIEAELAAGQRHFEQTRVNVWAEMLHRELAEDTRIVTATGPYILLCPFASRFPGQMCIFPQASVAGFESTSDADLQPLAELLKNALRSLDEVSPDAAFNLELHTAPPRDIRSASYLWRLAITPRLTGIAGFEVATESWINIAAPEDSANRYRRIIGSC